MTSNGSDLLHVRNFRENERSWNDRAHRPVAVFIGLSPGRRYFRCFENHIREGIDCRLLPGNSFTAMILKVIEQSGYPLHGVTKQERVESFSRRFCLVDFFESSAYVVPARRRIANGRAKIEEIVEPASLSITHIADKCRADGRVLLAISALGRAIEPENHGKPTRKRELRWLLWKALMEEVKKHHENNVIFLGWEDAYFWNVKPDEVNAKHNWDLSVRSALSKAMAEEHANME